MFTINPKALALVAILPLVSAIFPAAESYAACMDVAPTNYVDPVSVQSLGGSQNCSPYCFDKNYRYAYISPNSEQCGCSNLGPTSGQFATAVDADMNCTPDQWDVRIARTTFSTPTCYSGFAAGSDASFRRFEGVVPDVSACFTRCIDSDGANLVPLADSSGYQCTCDQNVGPVVVEDRVACAQGTLIRYGDHSPGQTTDGLLPAGQAPGPSQFVKRQQREQLRLESQKELSLCPSEGKACMVAEGLHSWECVDVATELESCGGCMFGELLNASAKSGVDCTTLPGVSMGGVTCTHGQCAIWACDPGFTLSERECVPTK